MHRPGPLHSTQPPTPKTPCAEDTDLPTATQLTEAVPAVATAPAVAVGSPAPAMAEAEPGSAPATGTTPLPIQEPPAVLEASTQAPVAETEELSSSVAPPTGPEADAARAAVEAAEAEAAVAEAALIAARAKAAAAKAKAEAAARAAVDSTPPELFVDPQQPPPAQPTTATAAAAPSSEQPAAEPLHEAGAVSARAQNDAEPSWLTDAAAVLAAMSPTLQLPSIPAVYAEGSRSAASVTDSAPDLDQADSGEPGLPAFEGACGAEASRGPEGETIEEIESRCREAEVCSLAELEGAGAAAAGGGGLAEGGHDGIQMPSSAQDDGILEFLGMLAPTPSPPRPHTGLEWDGQPMAEVTLWGRSAPAIASVERSLAWGEAMRGRQSSEGGDVQFVALGSAPPSPRQ